MFGAQPSGGKGIGSSSFPHVFPEKSGCLFQLIGNTPDHITVILILALSHVLAFKCKLMIYACKQYTCIMSALRRIFPLRLDSVTSVAYRKTSIKDKLRNSAVVYMPKPTQIAVTPLFTHVSQFNGITNVHSFNGFHSFYDFLRQTFFHNRYVLVTGKDTIKADTVVYNLSVDKDESYVIPAGIVHNCRCTVERVRRGKYPESDEAQAMLAGSQATAGKHQEMMRFNPGKQMACFPAYNPYTIRQCTACPDKPGTLKLAKVPDNELCAACRIIREMTRQKDELKKLRAEVKEKAQLLKERILRNEQFGKDIRVSGTNIKEWLNQPHKWIVEKNKMLPDIEKVIAEAPYLGCGPDKHDPDITMHLFETTVHDEKSWIIVRELIDGSIKLHSISDSEDILQYLTKRRE